LASLGDLRVHEVEEVEVANPHDACDDVQPTQERIDDVSHDAEISHRADPPELWVRRALRSAV
jgi:hypothetical protein